MAALQAALPQRSARAIQNWYNINKVALGLEKLLADSGHALAADKRATWA
jgi:hypothetical protein